METGSKGPSTATGRRSLLQRGLALVGGATAIGTGAWAARDVVAAPLRHGPTLTVYGRKRPVTGTNDTQIAAFGELLDAPDGAAIGEFHTNRFCLATKQGVQTAAGSNLEFHVLQLKDGTLFGLRGGTQKESLMASAIVGGTARYAGASGTLVERPVDGGTRGHDLVEFVVTFAG